MTMAVRKSLHRRIICSVRAHARVNLAVICALNFALVLKMPDVGSNPTPASAWAAGPIKIPPGDLPARYPTHLFDRQQPRAHAATSIRRGILWANGPRIRPPGSRASLVGASWNLEKSRRSPGPPAGSIRGERATLSGGAAEMYRSRRKSAASGANGPRIRRPRSMASRVGSSGNIEKSRRPPDSVYARFLFAGDRFPGGAPGTCESRRKRGASGANDTGIRRPGSTANRVGST